MTDLNIIAIASTVVVLVKWGVEIVKKLITNEKIKAFKLRAPDGKVTEIQVRGDSKTEQAELLEAAIAIILKKMDGPVPEKSEKRPQAIEKIKESPDGGS